jgi:cob(I)alamin adenosyltransferase
MVQVYTGNGKGKTTAAVGLALRVLGSGGRVYMAQLIKDRDSAEAAPLRRAGAIVEQFGRGMILGREIREEDRAAAREGMAAVRRRLGDAGYDLVVMDEGIVALQLGLISTESLLGIMALVAGDARAPELVITGRGADEAVIAAADLVSEMREIKHYFAGGLDARPGIEY